MSKERFHFGKHDIVTINGGTGSRPVNEGLLRTGKVEGINALASTTDNGGATGYARMKAREAGEPIIAVADAMKTLFTLVDPAELESEAYKAAKAEFYKREKLPDGGEVVAGQQLIYSLLDEEEGFAKVEELLRREKGLTIRGHIIPSSIRPTDISFTLASGHTFVGEQKLDDFAKLENMVRTVELDPKVEAFGPAIEAIKRAKHIVLSPGSFIGSIMAGLLPEGLKEALQNNIEADFIYIMNPVSTRLETHNFTLLDFIYRIEEITGRAPNKVLVPNMSRMQFEEKYSTAASMLEDRQKSHFQRGGKDELQAAKDAGVQVFTHDATRVYLNGSAEVTYDAATLGEKLIKVFVAKKDQMEDHSTVLLPSVRPSSYSPLVATT